MRGEARVTKHSPRTSRSQTVVFLFPACCAALIRFVFFLSVSSAGEAPRRVLHFSGASKTLTSTSSLSHRTEAVHRGTEPGRPLPRRHFHLQFRLICTFYPIEPFSFCTEYYINKLCHRKGNVTRSNILSVISSRGCVHYIHFCE